MNCFEAEDDLLFHLRNKRFSNKVSSLRLLRSSGSRVSFVFFLVKSFEKRIIPQSGFSGFLRPDFDLLAHLILLPELILILIQRHDIAILKLTVVFLVLLDCIIGQVDVDVCDLLRVQRIGLGRGPHISLLEHVDLALLVHKHPLPNVELPALDQLGLFKILLDHKVSRLHVLWNFKEVFRLLFLVL